LAIYYKPLHFDDDFAKCKNQLLKSLSITAFHIINGKHKNSGNKIKNVTEIFDLPADLMWLHKMLNHGVVSVLRLVLTAL